MASSNENQYPHLYIMDRTGELRDVVIDKSLTIGRRTASSTKDIMLDSARYLSVRTGLYIRIIIAPMEQ